MKTLSRALVSLVAVTFAVVGLGFWFATQQMAQMFGIDGVSGTGLVSLRADYGGLFLGVAVLCAGGAWAQRRAWLIAASVILTAAVVGRLIGGIMGGVAGIGVRDLAIELIALAMLTHYARSLGTEGDGVPPAGPVR